MVAAARDAPQPAVPRSARIVQYAVMIAALVRPISNRPGPRIPQGPCSAGIGGAAVTSLRKAVLVDDLSGSEATTRLVFGLGRRAYRIDLDDSNAAAFECAISPYLEAGSVVGQIRLAPAPKPDRRPPSDVAAVRDWATRNGIHLSDPDAPRLPGDVVAAYHAWQQAVSSGLAEQRHARRPSATATTAPASAPSRAGGLAPAS